MLFVFYLYLLVCVLLGFFITFVCEKQSPYRPSVVYRLTPVFKWQIVAWCNFLIEYDKKTISIFFSDSLRDERRKDPCTVNTVYGSFRLSSLKESLKKILIVFLSYSIRKLHQATICHLKTGVNL